MKYGKYEIKKVSVNDAMSRETICFSLDLYVDGKKFAAVSNDGRGGCHRTHVYQPFTQDDLARVEKEMSEDEFLIDDATFELFDTAVTSLLLLKDAAADVKKHSKSKAVYVDGDNLYTEGYRGGRAPDEALFARIRAQYPGATILNTMTVEASAVEFVKMQRRQLEAEMAANPLPGVPRP
ncbi:hypothetical protein OIU34_16835 [Pararhizobium sp. BT-229]|uniref:hypothetical protein n=1 Tax=Pararhizobium sp. BT-229 TaxID=2986923 RepID=UPI0021F70A50|nr:hypothetical protein [Pararhizobium sp. BT-229]MCV9963571.1 hypothetical protein [Pararhizobium sp. BT-229]